MAEREQCVPGQPCGCKLHALTPQFATSVFSLQCPCGFIASARGGTAVIESMRAHQEYELASGAVSR